MNGTRDPIPCCTLQEDLPKPTALQANNPRKASFKVSLCILHIFSQDNLVSWRNQAGAIYSPEIPEAMHAVALFLHVNLVFIPTHVISQTDKEDFTSIYWKKVHKFTWLYVGVSHYNYNNNWMWAYFHFQVKTHLSFSCLLKKLKSFLNSWMH